MSDRVRLTQRTASAPQRRRRAVEDSIPYPGTVNQPERKFKKRDQYDNFEQTVNHELPDMRTEWKNDERDNIGFGIPEGGAPTVASVRVAANKAVRMAVLLLGDRVADETIEEQARDFMAMSGDSMDSTLERFADSQSLYEAAEDEKKEEKAEEKEEEKKEASTEVKAEEKKEEEKKEDDSKEASTEVKAEEKKEEKEEEKKEDDSKEASTEVKAEEKAEEKKEEEKKEDDSKEASVYQLEAAPTGPNEMDIEMAASSSLEEVAPDASADAILAEALGMGRNDPKQGLMASDEIVTTTAKKKAGIKKLGGQPRAIAASDDGGMADLSALWNSAPDVSEIFQ